MVNTATWITFTAGLITVMNPLGNSAIYISLTADYDRKKQHKTAINCAIAIAIILITVIWIGMLLLHFFGISIGAFQVAGGIIVLLIALNMMRGESAKHSPHKSQQDAKPPNLAVVPMAIPIIAGPGAISTIIAHAAIFPGFANKVMLSIIALAIAILFWLLLTFAPLITKVLGDDGMQIVVRVMGLILAAIAIQMFGSGLLALLPGLQG